MRVLYYLVASAMLLAQSSAFVPSQNQGTVSRTRVVTSFGLLDFFSEENRQKRQEEDRKRREEQEEVQRQILEMRQNPEKEAEYYARVRVRRKMIMDGKDVSGFQVMKDEPANGEE